MKKIFAVLSGLIIMLATSAVPALALVQNPPFHINGKTSCSSLSDAFKKAAASGSIIQQDGIIGTVYETGDNITVTKDATLITGTDFYHNTLSISYTGNGAPLFKIANGGTLTLRDSTIKFDAATTLSCGKLICVEAGGTLVLGETAPATFNNSSDGLIQVNSGGRVVLCNAVFNGNPGGGDIRVEDGGIMLSDLNGDRQIDVRDLVRAKKHLTSPEAVSVTGSPDCNRDGNENAADLLLLKQYLLGI